MKNLKYLFFSLLATVAFAACSDDETLQAEPDVENCYDVYFPEQDNADDLTLDPEAPTSLEFTIMRNNDKDAITVPVEILASEEGIFTASEVVFAEGQTETTFTVDFPGAKSGTTYECTIRVTDPQYVSLYSDKPAFVSFSVLRAKWIQVDADKSIFYDADDGEGEKEYKGYEWYTEDLIHPLFGLPTLSYPVRVFVREDTLEDPENYPNGSLAGLYRIEKCYGDTWPVGADGTANDILIDARDPKKVFIPTQSTGIRLNSKDDYYLISSIAYLYMNDPEEDPDQYYGKIENGAIVFPSNSLIIAIPAGPNKGTFQLNPSGAFRLEICQDQAVDYSLKLEAGESVNGKLDIAAEFGADVAKVKYAFFEGSLSPAQANESSSDIDAGKIESAKEITASGVLTAELAATGVYTMIANIYDKDNALQGYEMISFGYVAAGDEQPVVISCGINITDRYAPQGFTSEDSAEIYVYGENIVSGSYALIEADKLAAIEDMDAYLSKSGKAFTAEQLEAINGNGFSGVIGNLIGGTEYVLVVKAFNGYVSDYATASATTNGTPHPLKRTYTIDDLTNAVEKADLFKSWNLWAVDHFDENGITKRQHFGQITFSENTQDDAEEVDAINVKGISFGQSETDDTVVWEYYNGVIYTLGGQLTGTVTHKGSTLYLLPAYIDANGTGTKGNYAMCAAYVAEGYIALVSNNPDYNLNGMLFQAYTDAEATNNIGNWAYYSDIMFEDPAVAGAATASVAPAKKTSLQSLRNLAANAAAPANFVELRGQQRMRALIDEIRADKKAIRNAAQTIEPVAMPALGAADAKVSFRSGLPKQSFDQKQLVVKHDAVRFDK